MIQNVTLIGNVYAPGNGASTEIVGPATTWPLEIPEGAAFYITHMLLVNKYPWNPPAYDPPNLSHMASCYLVTNALTVTSYNPDVHFNPPYRYLGGSPFRGWINNGQSEAQYCYGMVQGYLEWEEVKDD